jgi:hypothetical protein
MIRIKFKCSHILHANPVSPNEPGVSVSFSAVEDPENSNWSKDSVYSNLVINITNPDALETFAEGDFYYVDFESAPEPVVSPSPKPEPVAEKQEKPVPLFTPPPPPVLEPVKPVILVTEPIPVPAPEIVVDTADKSK